MKKLEKIKLKPLCILFLIILVLWNFYGVKENILFMSRISNIIYDLSKILVIIIFYSVIVKNDFKNMSLKLFLLLVSTVNAISLIAMQMTMGIDERMLIFPLVFVIVTIVSIKKYTSSIY